MKRCLVRIFSVPNALLPSCRSPYPSLPENRHENHRENTGISDKTNYFYYIYLRLYRFRLAILERRIAENCEPDRRGSYLSQQHPNNILYHENRIHTCRQSETPDGLSIFRQKIRRTRIQSELRRASFHITPSREPISSPPANQYTKQEFQFTNHSQKSARNPQTFLLFFGHISYPHPI